MRQTDAVIVGAGQAGLAMSHCLSRLGIDHIVLERGRVAERWRSERWDSLRLLTPNWMTQLPGWPYRGTDPDGFMTAAEVVEFLEQYASAFAAPVVAGATVQSVRRVLGGYRIESDHGVWHAQCVVIATGHCDVPFVPNMARYLPASIHQLTPTAYRNPSALPGGGVLVIGASASGVQLADEIQRSGRQVTIAVSRHTRLPRLYRGRDIMWWLDRYPILEAAITAAELGAARLHPSMQLVGRPERTDLDLAVLRNIGVRLIGRVASIEGNVLQVNSNLADAVAGSHGRMERLLKRIDIFADAIGATDQVWPAGFSLDPSPTTLNLTANNIKTVIWATGFVRNYRWLHVPVIDSSGEIIHTGGVTPSRGLYVIGLRFLRRRDASFIGAVRGDANELATDIQLYLNATPASQPSRRKKICSLTKPMTCLSSGRAVPALLRRC
jgi:putative flavoprotein involved in K+ transport